MPTGLLLKDHAPSWGGTLLVESILSLFDKEGRSPGCGKLFVSTSSLLSSWSILTCCRRQGELGVRGWVRVWLSERVVPPHERCVVVQEMGKCSLVYQWPSPKYPSTVCWLSGLRLSMGYLSSILFSETAERSKRSKVKV